MRFSSTLAWLTLGTATLLSSKVGAYRPFDQTDADVLEDRRVEIDLGPVEVERSSGELVLVAPPLVINYGMRPRLELELVVEGKNERLGRRR